MPEALWNPPQIFANEWSITGMAILSGGGSAGPCQPGEPGWAVIHQGSPLTAEVPLPDPSYMAAWPYARLTVGVTSFIYGARGAMGCEGGGGGLIPIGINFTVSVGEVISHHGIPSAGSDFNNFPLTFVGPPDIPPPSIVVDGTYGALTVSMWALLQRWDGPDAGPPPPSPPPVYPGDPYELVTFVPLPYPGCAKGFPPVFGGVDAGVVEQ